MSEININGGNQNINNGQFNNEDQNVNNNNQQHYTYDDVQADLNGLNDVQDYDEIDNGPDEILNEFEVISEYTDVPELSDALISKKKALNIFKAPLETHDNFERTLARKHKFSFFEKILCVVTFGLASPLIKHLNKSNDRREADELKNNTIIINQVLTHMTKGGPTEKVGMNLYDNGKLVHALLERNDKDQLYIKLPGMQQRVKLPYDLEQMKTLIATDICSHIDIYGIDAALLGLDAQDKDANRRGMLTNILSHMTGGEKNYHELSVMDFNSLESVVKNIRDNSYTMREAGKTDQEIQQSNKEYLDTQLQAIEQKCRLINTKLNNSLGQKEALYDSSVKEIQAKLHELDIEKMRKELKPLSELRKFYEQKIAEIFDQKKAIESKKDLTEADLLKLNELQAQSDEYKIKHDETLNKEVQLVEDINFEESELKKEQAELNKPQEPLQVEGQGNNAPQDLGEQGKHSPKINSLYVDSIIEKLEAEKKENPQTVSQKVDTNVISKGKDTKYSQKVQELKQKIELVKDANKDVIEKFDNELKTLKSSAEDELKNYYAADELGNKILNLNKEFTKNRDLKNSYDAKVEKLKADIDKLQKSQSPKDQETLETLNTELNTLTKNPPYLSDGQIMKNFILDNKEVFASLNAEIARLMKENNSYDERMALQNSPIGKILNVKLLDIVYDICRDIGFDKQKSDAVFREVKAFEMQKSVTGFFGNIFGKSIVAPKTDVLAEKLAEVAKDISNLEVIKAQNMIAEFSIALDGKKLNYESFKELKQKFNTIMYNFENANNVNYITKQVPEHLRNLLSGLLKATNSDAFDSVLDKFRQSQNIASTIRQIEADIKPGLSANDTVRMIFAKANDKESVDENKPVFKLFSEIVKSTDRNEVKKYVESFKPYMSKENYTLLEGLSGIFSGFVGTRLVKTELTNNPNADLLALFKEKMNSALKGSLVSVLALLEEQLKADPLSDALKTSVNNFKADHEKTCVDLLCTRIQSLFKKVEILNINRSLENIEKLSYEGKLDKDALRAEFAKNPALLVALLSNATPDGIRMTSQQKLLLSELRVAVGPLRAALNSAYSTGKQSFALSEESLRELVNKLLYSHDYDPITLEKNKFNPITSELRNVYSNSLTTAVSLLPKVVTSLDIDGKDIGSATISDNGTADYRMVMGRQLVHIAEVENDERDYARNVEKYFLDFEKEQKATIAEQRSFWVHNFLADLIFEEEGNQFDKEIDKLEKGEGNILEPGSKIQRLLNKHAKALAYMIKDPQALNTLPSLIKDKIVALIEQIKKSGLDFIAAEDGEDFFTDQQLEQSAELIRSVLNFDITKGTAELTEAQLSIKLSLVSAEQELESSVDGILDEISNMIFEEQIEDAEEQLEERLQRNAPAGQGQNAPVGQEQNAPVPEGENAPQGNAEAQGNQPANNADKNDPLNPNSTLQDLDNASRSDDNVMVKFVNNVRKTYFTKLTKMDKLSMVAAAIRYSRAEIDGKISNDKMIGAAFKGAGPIMQKLLQKTPQEDISDDLKKSFSDMKSNLAPIPENVVQAHLLQIVNNSEGKIKKIEIERSLGAASVGEAFLCKVYTADKPQGVDCVIKILRPDVMNRAHRELDIFREAAKDIPGMDVTFEGSLKTIMEELDLTNEAQNVVSGQLYSNFDPNVQSMKLFDLVPPSTDVLIIEKAPGVTVNNVINSMENKLVGDILKPAQGQSNTIPGVELPLFYSTVEEMISDLEDLSVDEETYQNMQKQLLDEFESVIEQRNNLVKFSKELVTQGIFDTGFYHGDLHAGNIMTSKDKLTIIDFGNCVKLTPLQQENILRMMAASLDKNGPIFMQGLKTLLSPESLRRLSEVKEYKGVEKTVEEHLTEVISAILKKGKDEDTGLKIKLVMEAILKEGIEIPAPIYNFEVCQNSLQNTIEEMNSQIDCMLRLFLRLGLAVEDSHHLNLSPSSIFAKKAAQIFVNVTKFKDASKSLLKLYNDELDNLQKDPNDALKNKIKHVGESAKTPNIELETDYRVKSAFNFKGDAHFKELYSNWQTIRLANKAKTDADEEVSVADTNSENEAFEAFYTYYKEKQTTMMQQEYEHLKRFLELRNKPDESFLTGMGEVLLKYKWDAMGTLGTLKSIKYAFKGMFA